MIKLHISHLEEIRSAKGVIDLALLHKPLQGAIELEHATIPPYLTAMFSLRPLLPLSLTGEKVRPEKDRVVKEVKDIIHSVVIEEMMHMSIACNILTALGGHPFINKEGFVPTYPGKLPMAIDHDLTVELRKYSLDQVKNVFMSIEEPDDPIIILKSANKSTGGLLEELLNGTKSLTIGQFYTILKLIIQKVAPDQLPGDPSKQVTSNFFPADEFFPILTKDDACRAIDIIIEQGEGTSTSIEDEDGEIAHYYKFQELYKERKIIFIKGVPHFRGESLALDPDTDVRNISPEATRAYTNNDSKGLGLVQEFNDTYRSLLNGLHDVFNGKPHELDSNIGLMFDLTIIANQICEIEIPDSGGLYFSPTFEFE